MRKRKKNNFIPKTQEVFVDSIELGGKGVAKVDSYVYFIDGALPGQKLLVKETKRKNKYSFAKIIKVIERSSFEVDNNFQNVPGNPWINISIDKQTKFKQEQIIETFKRLSNINITDKIDEIINSPEEYFYRNKMEYSFGHSKVDYIDEKNKHLYGFGLGSKKRGHYYLVENLEKPSGLFDKDLENNLKNIRNFLEKTNFSVYCNHKRSGFFRNILVRKSFYENKLYINFITTSEESKNFDIDAFYKYIKDIFSERLKGFIWSIDDHPSDAFRKDAKIIFKKGEEKLIEKINSLYFEISPTSFFQTNPLCAEKLYKKTIDYVDNDKYQNILDLYCGTGTISQIIAANLPNSKITGIEIEQSSVNDAISSSNRNNINNVSFICQNTSEFFKTCKPNLFDTIVLDPPRAGVSKKYINKVVELNPKKIVYVSCNPATLARDTVLLNEKYSLEKISIIDQFPHTSHVECVSLFNLR